MAKTLKEALLEKYSDLQERGLAPTATPTEDEGPSVIVEMGPENRRDVHGRRGRSAQTADYEEEVGVVGESKMRPRTRPRKMERGERPQNGGERSRRADRPPSERTALMDAPVAIEPALPPQAPRPSGRPPFPGRPSPERLATRRPLEISRRPGPPDGHAPRAPSVTDRLRERADERRRDGEQRERLQKLLGSTGDDEAAGQGLEKFLADLSIEVGALPPLERVVQAVELAHSTEVFKVGQQIRQLYRRSRPRPAAVPS